MTHVRCPTCDNLESRDGLRCEFCYDCCSDLFEGWFYTEARLNPWAKGTASAGLMQRRISCKKCADKAKEVGLR